MKLTAYTECFCANVVNNASTLQSDSSCNMACSGNSSEACGGPNLLDIYYANKPAPQGPVTNPGPAGWTSFGCYADGSTKSLANGVQVPGGGSNLTVSSCTTACGAAGYTLAGVEYAGGETALCHTSDVSALTASECYCDNYLASSASNTTLSQCNMPCNGNSSEFCGAGNRMNIYASGNTQPTTKSVASVPATPGGWFPFGGNNNCFNDTNGRRSLSNTQYLQVPMTIEACTSACLSAGYTLAGLEYAG